MIKYTLLSRWSEFEDKPEQSNWLYNNTRIDSRKTTTATTKAQKLTKEFNKKFGTDYSWSDLYEIDAGEWEYNGEYWERID